MIYPKKRKCTCRPIHKKNIAKWVVHKPQLTLMYYWSSIHVIDFELGWGCCARLTHAHIFNQTDRFFIFTSDGIVYICTHKHQPKDFVYNSVRFYFIPLILDVWIMEETSPTYRIVVDRWTKNAGRARPKAGTFLCWTWADAILTLRKADSLSLCPDFDGTI